MIKSLEWFKNTINTKVDIRTSEERFGNIRRSRIGMEWRRLAIVKVFHPAEEFLDEIYTSSFSRGWSWEESMRKQKNLSSDKKERGNKSEK